MTRDEIVTALREHADRSVGNEWGSSIIGLYDNLSAVVDLIENQQRHIEALMKANDSLKGAIARRDKQIAVRCRECKQGEVDDPDFPDQYYCHAGCGWNNGDFYCAYGEREEGADNG